jgi:hypothetical protein
LRRRVTARKIVAKRGCRVAERVNRVHEPPVSLPLMSYPFRLTELAAHRVHRVREVRNRSAEIGALKVAEHLVAVLHSGHLTQRLVEQAPYTIIGIPLAHRCDDVVEMQIPKALGRCVNVLGRGAMREQDARHQFTTVRTREDLT